jgi:hypothetical protein
MNKALALALMLCLLGSSMATDHFVSKYATSDCASSSLYIEEAINNDASCDA